MPRNILLYGGGLDSTALALDMKHNQTRFEMVHFNYGQKAAKEEADSATYWAQQLGVKLTILPAQVFGFSGATILNHQALADTPKANVLNLRNPVLFAIAASWATSTYGDKDIAFYLGFHEEPDGSPFKDARAMWLDDMCESLSLACDADISWSVPFVCYTRLDILRIGVAHHPEFLNRAYTCYEANGPCGQCSHCRQLAEMKIELESTNG